LREKQKRVRLFPSVKQNATLATQFRTMETATATPGPPELVLPKDEPGAGNGVTPGGTTITTSTPLTGSNKKPPQKRKKPAASPQPSPSTKPKQDSEPAAADGSTTNGEQVRPVPEGSSQAEPAPVVKKQKKKHTEEGKQTTTSTTPPGKKQKGATGKHVRFHIKLYSASKQPTAATTAGIAKKKKAKQQQAVPGVVPEQQHKQQNGATGAEPKKKASKKGRTAKVNGGAEYFHCMTGANFYLTPPGSQGFAPHYDDIEAFVLQIEGRKRWRLYGPRQPQEVLARVSSENLRQDELAGPPIVDVVLEAGDLLYFPRGCIHQAATVPGAHSLHITVSVYQRNCWADLFEQMLPIALATAADTEPQLREGLPLDLHQHFGIVHSDGVSADRRRLIVRIRAMFDKLFSDAAIDAAVDQLAKRFQHDALPPLVDFGEWDDTVYGGGNYEFRPDGTVRCARPIDDRSSVRLLRRNILRLVSEEEKLRIYYHTDNSREYHQYEANFLELDHETALGVELLIKMYPRYVLVSSLPVEDRLEFIRSLWEKGLIVCRRPGEDARADTSASTP
uniref:Bifunctional lysine-specific demethylase and histidyl-hydroxylase n=1 Tax=Anopheles coluzzii TaxID=1518534 RepID=A0A8W7P0F4_ANOCL